MKYNFTKGITIVETLVALGIFSIVFIAVSTFQRDVIQYGATASGSLTTSYDARIILRTITRELRTSSVGNNGAYPLAQAGTSSITFFADTDSDNLKEQIRYYIASTTLKKGVIKPTGSPLTYVPGNEVVTILTSNIRNSTSTPLFTYYGSNYDGTTEPYGYPIPLTSVRLVNVNLILDADINRSPVSRSYTSQVTLRNLKDNL
ncbi:MAG: hypothetical protein HZA80_00580 [Candidatus Taylorbacteria bacterium]|nr:hypothetical protein [Candidatus Taylorbacteria bacterium]